MTLQKELNNLYEQVEPGLYVSESSGYWSNLSEDENRELISSLNELPAREALAKYQPELEDVIYSPKRPAGLELLGLTGDEVCVDYGCMWGAMTVPLARRCGAVVGIDQTLDSLRFLKARLREEKIDNVDLVCMNLNGLPVMENKVDAAIVNGVLEWMPEQGRIALKTYYGKYQQKDNAADPYAQQMKFLKGACGNLKNGGKMYLAIENRYDFKMFLGVKDPHPNLAFTSILPRRLANLVSKKKLGRPYVNWLYSFGGIRDLMTQAGFSRVDLYMCFPDYRFPERIMPYEQPLKNYEATITARNDAGKLTFRRLGGKLAEMLAFKVFRAKCLAPSIIAIGHK